MRQQQGAAAMLKDGDPSHRIGGDGLPVGGH